MVPTYIKSTLSKLIPLTELTTLNGEVLRPELPTILHPTCTLAIDSAAHLTNFPSLLHYDTNILSSFYLIFPMDISISSLNSAQHSSRRRIRPFKLPMLSMPIAFSAMRCEDGQGAPAESGRRRTVATALRLF